MENLRLRLLDPTIDLDLYREAFNWRSTPKRHTSAPQMSFETFSDTDPTHLTFGLFNSELIAVYFLREWERGKYEAHFTSRRKVSRETLLQGARVVLDLILANGATEVSALILPTNRPLRQFVIDLGMVKESHVLFTCVSETHESSIEPRNQRVFVKYAARVQSPSV